MSETKPIQSILRAIDILELLTEASQGLRLIELAEAMDLKTPTVHNLVKTLASRGLVEKLNTNLYAAGPRLMEMAERVQNNQHYGQAESLCRSLANLPCQPIVIFSVASGNRLMVKLRMSPDRPNLIQRPTGQLNALYYSATGLALLAFDNEVTIKDLKQNEPFYEYGIRVWGNYKALEDYLVEVRHRGYADTHFEGQDHYRIATPLRNKKGIITSYIGIAVDASAFKEKDLQIQLVNTFMNIVK
jgi:DNA-binding IclR family transcriptional regulator